MTKNKDDLDEIFDKALEHGSVILTDDEDRSIVLMKAEDYEKLIEQRDKLRSEVAESLNKISEKEESKESE